MVLDGLEELEVHLDGPSALVRGAIVQAGMFINGQKLVEMEHSEKVETVEQGHLILRMETVMIEQSVHHLHHLAEAEELEEVVTLEV